MPCAQRSSASTLSCAGDLPHEGDATRRANNTDKATTTPRRRALTLVELTVALGILAVAVGCLIQTLGYASLGQERLAKRQRALCSAQNVAEDVLQCQGDWRALCSQYDAASDLEVTVPKGASVECVGRFGDFDIANVAGDVDIKSDNAGVRMADEATDRYRLSRDLTAVSFRYRKAAPEAHVALEVMPAPLDT